MDEESEQVDADEVYGLVVAALAQLQEPAEVRTDGVWLANWPSVRISLDRALAYQAAPQSEVWQAWIDLSCMYNSELPFTTARTHAVGLGLARSKAIADTVDNWKEGIAPALLSYIYGVLVADAETWPAAEGQAVSGWDCITGPYVLRGDQASVVALGDFLKREPMMGPVRERLTATLEAGGPFHTVSLYRAQTAAGTFADVLINNEPDSVTGELLKSMQWPEQLAGVPYIAARHFMLCIAPNATDRPRPATRSEAAASNTSSKPLPSRTPGAIMADWVAKAYELFKQQKEDIDILRYLVSEGCSRALAEKLLVFFPHSCALNVLDDTGVTFSKNFRCMRTDGSVGPPRLLASDPDWVAINSFVLTQMTAEKDALAVIMTRSAEFDSINQALNNGSELKNLVSEDPIFMFTAASGLADAPEPARKPWWAFWR
jgi:hypothetical protein